MNASVWPGHRRLAAVVVSLAVASCAATKGADVHSQPAHRTDAAGAVNGRSGAVWSDDVSHERAILDLLDVMGFEKSSMETATAMADVMMQSNPMLVPYKDVLVAWTRDIMTSEATKREVVRIYKEAFTESEAQDLVAFYETPTGQKLLAELPEIMRKSMAFGVGLVRERQAELQQRIAERAEEIRRKME